MPVLTRLLLFVSMLLAHPAIAEELLGQVVGISDGDTLTLLIQDHRQVRVRLAGIDASESRQPYGNRARQELPQLSFRQTVRVIVEDTDRYGRTVGKVMLRMLDFNAKLVRRGAAWVYPQYNRDPALPPLQAAARQAQRGLWALLASEQVPPWDWRQNGRSASTSSPPPVSAPSRPFSPPQASSGSGMSCGSKRYCSQMTSCAEAQFHSRHCGLARLDGDRDGVPCEQLCH